MQLLRKMVEDTAIRSLLAVSIEALALEEAPVQEKSAAAQADALIEIAVNGIPLGEVRPKLSGTDTVQVHSQPWLLGLHGKTRLYPPPPLSWSATRAPVTQLTQVSSNTQTPSSPC